MNFLHAIILGIVEGITEFLPISSTGHLILTAGLLKLQDSDFLTTFEIVIQLGAILAVVVLYAKKLFTSWSLIKKIAVAFIPTAIVGAALYPVIKNFLLSSDQVVIWALFVGGVVLYFFEKKFLPSNSNTLETMSYKQALGIGLAQSVAVVPGVSRAAATIVGGLIAGLDRKSVVEFSFLLAIPTMAAASGLDLLKNAGSFNAEQFQLLAVGFVVAFFTAMLAVKWLLKFIERHNFAPFGVYRIALAFLFWLWLM